MTATRVDYTSAISQAWQNLYDVVDTRSNVADPSTATTEIRKFVYARDPDVKKVGFSGYPYIVVNLPTIETVEGRRSADTKNSIVVWTTEIEVVTNDRGYNNQEGKGAEWNNSISDDIFQTFNSTTIRNSLRANGLANINLGASPVVVEEENNTLVYRRSFIITCMNRLQVST